MRSVVLVALAGCLVSPHEVFLSDKEWEIYWEKATERSERWFGEQAPELPSLDTMKRRVKWIEEEPGGKVRSRNEGPGGRSVIFVPSDEWYVNAGPTHELLHAALYELDHPCKSAIEHVPFVSVAACGTIDSE